MTLGDERAWLTGQRVSAWEYKMRINQTTFNQKIVYKYSIRNDDKDTTLWEREPSREFIVQDPSQYTGQLG